MEIPLRSRAVRLEPSPYAQDKDFDEDWTSETRYQRLTFDIFANSSDPAARIIPNREIQPVVHSPGAITEVERWIDSCAAHVDCSTTSDLLLPLESSKYYRYLASRDQDLLSRMGFKGDIAHFHTVGVLKARS